MSSKSAGEGYDKLEPRLVWEFFAGLAAVPRPSKHEERVCKHVRELAKRLELPATEDAKGNIVLKVPATPGHEGAAVLVLQAHLDMVCEKNASTQHDFDTQGISLLVEDEAATGEQIVRGDGTTLGADNGMGVALALAAATEPDVVHGPLELLFTTDEEDGMTGAKALTSASFTGRIMLNLDSEEDDALCIGCAGGCDTNVAWTLATESLPKGVEVVRVNVTGLRGGHSGCDIHEGRANAIKLMVRALSRAPQGSLQLLSISGGSKRNAIPREAQALVAGSVQAIEALKKGAAAVAQEGLLESYEPQVSIDVESVNDGHADAGVSLADTARVIAAMSALPSCVLGMHPKVAGLVETSNNVSTIGSSVSQSTVVVEVGMLSRSSSDSRIAETVDRLAAIGTLSGGRVSHANEYPGWAPNPDSPTLATCTKVYKEMFDCDPEVGAIHAGLECGIIGKLVGDMEMVSLGPTIRGAHSPDERVYTASVERTWRYLVKLLEVLAKS